MKFKKIYDFYFICDLKTSVKNQKNHFFNKKLKNYLFKGVYVCNIN